MENFENEIWKDIPEFEGYYQASTLGRVKSLDRVVECVDSKRKLTIKGKIKLSQKRGNYRVIQLCKNGCIKQFTVHKLIYTTFLGNVPEGCEINHKDENPSNNALSNLEAVTHRENMNWGTRNERVSEKMTNGKLSKPVIQYDLDGNRINEFLSTMDVQRQYGYNNSNIQKCCNNKPHYNTAYGYIWKYKEQA